MIPDITTSNEFLLLHITNNEFINKYIYGFNFPTFSFTAEVLDVLVMRWEKVDAPDSTQPDRVGSLHAKPALGTAPGLGLGS
jgi:hypothetical protein